MMQLLTWEKAGMQRITRLGFGEPGAAGGDRQPGLLTPSCLWTSKSVFRTCHKNTRTKFFVLAQKVSTDFVEFITRPSPLSFIRLSRSSVLFSSRLTRGKADIVRHYSSCPPNRDKFLLTFSSLISTASLLNAVPFIAVHTAAQYST